MSVLRVNFLPGFYLGDDAVLLTLDGAGVETMNGALEEAIAVLSSRFHHEEVAQEFSIEPGAATVEMSPARVVWRLDHAKASEIWEDLIALSATPSAAHFYVDMICPAGTLAISRDEYTDVVYPWVSPH